MSSISPIGGAAVTSTVLNLPTTNQQPGVPSDLTSQPNSSPFDIKDFATISTEAIQKFAQSKGIQVDSSALQKAFSHIGSEISAQQGGQNGASPGFGIRIYEDGHVTNGDGSPIDGAPSAQPAYGPGAQNSHVGGNISPFGGAKISQPGYGPGPQNSHVGGNISPFGSDGKFDAESFVQQSFAAIDKTQSANGHSYDRNALTSLLQNVAHGISSQLASGAKPGDLQLSSFRIYDDGHVTNGDGSPLNGQTAAPQPPGSNINLKA